jgi:iron complex transport system substrate-binding protein
LKWSPAAAAAVAVASALTASAAAAPRVLSLDQCADQYVLALSPREAIVGISKRALNADSYLRVRAKGLPQRRAASESVLAARPEVVVRYWGGDARLLADLRRLGVRVVTIGDANDFEGVRGNIRNVARALDAPSAGDALIARMNRQLAESAGGWDGAGAAYLTSGGATTGEGTLIDAMMRAAGLSNIAGGRGYHALSLERLILQPPRMFVLGFFDPAQDPVQGWSPGRHQALERLIRTRPSISLPSTILGCPAWFAADGARLIAAANPAFHPAAER